jgi:hypothetical protein
MERPLLQRAHPKTGGLFRHILLVLKLKGGQLLWEVHARRPRTLAEGRRRAKAWARLELRLCCSRDQLQVIPSVNGRIEQNGPSEVEGHADRQGERGRPLLSYCCCDHEREGRYQADHGEDVLPERKILSSAGRSSFVLAGEPVHCASDEESEDGAAQERECDEQIDDACHRPWDRLIACKVERPARRRLRKGRLFALGHLDVNPHVSGRHRQAIELPVQGIPWGNNSDGGVVVNVLSSGEPLGRCVRRKTNDAELVAARAELRPRNVRNRANLALYEVRAGEGRRRILGKAAGPVALARPPGPVREQAVDLGLKPVLIASGAASEQDPDCKQTNDALAHSPAIGTSGSDAEGDTALPQASLENGSWLAAEQPCLGRGGEAVLRRPLL